MPEINRAMIGLWEHLFDPLEGYLLTLTGKQSGAKDNDLIDTEQRAWQWPEKKHEAAEHLLQESNRGRDAFFGVHLYKTPFNRKGDNAAPHVLALWVDGDGAEVPEDWPQPTAVVESSPGRHHYYWRLTRPIPPEEAAALNKRLVYGMGGDKGKWGLGTVLRPPQTRNYKRATPTEVREVVCA